MHQASERRRVPQEKSVSEHAVACGSYEGACTPQQSGWCETLSYRHTAVAHVISLMRRRPHLEQSSGDRHGTQR